MSETSEDPYALIPELGDLVTIVSDLYSTTTGRIIYRDGTLIRVRPFYLSDRAIEFPLDPETGLFREALGVQELILHEKAKTPYFSKQLAVVEGEQLEFFSVQGISTEAKGIVKTVIATEDKDQIELEDGRILDFQFLGPQPPFEVIVPRSAPEDVTAPENNAAAASDVVEPEPQEEFPEIDFSLLPAALVEEIPTSERTYSDTIQREDMFVSLLSDVPLNKQKNPKVLRNLYRKTDILMALKNSVVVRDETGGILQGQQRSYMAKTVKEVLDLQPTGSPIPSIIPVAAVKKILYTDDETMDTEFDDVEIRPDVSYLVDLSRASEDYRKKVPSEFQGNPFITYIDTLIRKNQLAYVPSQPGEQPPIRVDQDVLRTRIPTEPVQGFPADLPPADSESGLTSDFLATIEDRTVRLLSASTIQDVATGQRFQVAPANTAATVAHIVLSGDAAAYRSATRSSVLLWDIQASETSRATTQSFYRYLKTRWADQQVIESESDADLAKTIADTIPPILKFVSRSTLRVLDGFGLRSLEWTEALMEPMLAALETGQKAWDEAMKQLRSRAANSLRSKDTDPLFPAVETLENSDLWSEAVLANSEITAALSQLRDSDPKLADTVTARAAYFSTGSNFTLGGLWYALAGHVAEEAMKAAESTYINETRRIERNLANVRRLAAELQAAPSINPCKHVKELESIRGIRNETKRMLVFQKFVSQYQSGQKGNWIQCGACKQDLVCRHEVLLLNEFLHPGRGTALHKALLLEFSGPVFEGAYICKNCGQKISDLEYDSHLEFDDDGKPLVGRTIVDPSAEEGEDLTLPVALQEEADQEVNDGFSANNPLRSLYYIARAVLESAGITPSKELYDRIVPAADQYLRLKIPPQLYYEKRKPAKAPEYANFVASSQIGVLGALTILELQTSNLSIPFPARGCVFQRGGFPLEATGNGAMQYVICVIAGVLRNSSPWTEATWSRETQITKRQANVEFYVRKAMFAVLALPETATAPTPSPIENVTNLYMTRLETERMKRVRSEIAGEDVEGVLLASDQDRLPQQFRPAPRMRKGEDAAGIQNVEQFKKNVETQNLEAVQDYVRSRQSQLIQTVMKTFHTSSLASAKDLGVLSEASPYSDSVCCFQPLGIAAVRGCGVPSLKESLGEAQLTEVEALDAAARRVRQRDPVRSSNGSHFFVPWSAPSTEWIDPTADPSMYYLLFLKHCFRGENLGAVHEYQDNFVCRHCDFQYPQAIEFMTPSDLEMTGGFEKRLEAMNAKRKEIILKAFAEQGIVMDDVTFHALEDAVHFQKLRTQAPPVEETTRSDLLAKMEAVLKTAPFVDSAMGQWKLFKGSQQSKQIYDFVEQYDRLFEAIQLRLTALLGPKPTAAEKKAVEDAMQGFLRITRDVQSRQAVRNVRSLFVTGAEQIAQEYENKTPKVNKWFPKVSKSHKALLEKIWETQNAVVSRGLHTLSDRLNEDARKLVQTSLATMSSWLGSWLQVWNTEVRPLEFSEETLQYLLRWSVLHVMAGLLTEKAPVYAEATHAIEKDAILFFRGWFVDCLKTSAAQDTLYHLTPEEVKDALHIRTEMEKAMFIQRMDNLTQEERKVELIKKSLKLGDWSVGNKNQTVYDPEYYEIERQQRSQMGLPQFTGDVTGVAEAGSENPYGFFQFGQQSEADGAYEHRGRHDEDE